MTILETFLATMPAARKTTGTTAYVNLGEGSGAEVRETAAGLEVYGVPMGGGAPMLEGVCSTADEAAELIRSFT